MPLQAQGPFNEPSSCKTEPNLTVPDVQALLPHTFPPAIGQECTLTDTTHTSHYGWLWCLMNWKFSWGLKNKNTANPGWKHNEQEERLIAMAVIKWEALIAS